jgi:hypothetical protein
VKSRRNFALLYRSHTRRSLRAVYARLLALAISLGAVAGCQSNSDRDLIARDRRMQEDQIYALQDYVNQYQRLLCKYRSENASLRRQLSKSYPVETQSTEQQPALHSRLIPTPKDSPQFQAPATPGVKQQQAPPPTAPPAVETPDVPPLKTSTDATPPASAEYANVRGDNGSTTPLVVPASYEESVLSNKRSENGDNADTSNPPQNSTPLNLTGEVVANGNRGPRLKIEVTPVDQSKPFVGTTSLMLLAVNEAGEQHSLGRWDYSANDVQAALDTTAPVPLMRYFVELPSGVPLNESTQLWVRLVPQSGEKLLAHANVNLSSPGTFSSAPLPSRPQHSDVVAASYTEDQSAPTTDVPAEMSGSPWAIALPGKPANLSPEVRDESGAGGWRASSEPIPVAPIAASDDRPASKRHLAIQKEKPAENTAKEAPEPPAKRTGWSPDRSGNSPQSVATKPSWSATR